MMLPFTTSSKMHLKKLMEHQQDLKTFIETLHFYALRRRKKRNQDVATVCVCGSTADLKWQLCRS